MNVFGFVTIMAPCQKKCENSFFTQFLQYLTTLTVNRSHSHLQGCHHVHKDDCSALLERQLGVSLYEKKHRFVLNVGTSTVLHVLRGPARRKSRQTVQTLLPGSVSGLTIRATILSNGFSSSDDPGLGLEPICPISTTIPPLMSPPPHSESVRLNRAS